jgi:hypothetical protein
VVFPLSLSLPLSLSTLIETVVCLGHDDIDFLRANVISSFFLLLVVVGFCYGVDTVNSLLRPIVLFSRLTSTAVTTTTTTTKDK